MSLYSKRRTNWWPLVIILVVTGIIAVIASVSVSYYHETWHSGCVVNDKDRTKDSDGHSDARVYTDNCGVFQVSDSVIKGHFNSADTYSSIKVGQTYDFKTIGWRVPFLSAFPNIIDAKQVD